MPRSFHDGRNLWQSRGRIGRVILSRRYQRWLDVLHVGAKVLLFSREFRDRYLMRIVCEIEVF